MNGNADGTEKITYRDIWDDTNDIRWLFFMRHLSGEGSINELRRFCLDMVKYTNAVIPAFDKEPVEDDVRFITAELYYEGSIGIDELKNSRKSFSAMFGDAGKMAKMNLAFTLNCLTFENEYKMFSAVTGCILEAIGSWYKEKPAKAEEFRTDISDKFRIRFADCMNKLNEDKGFTPEAIELLRTNGFYPVYTGRNGWMITNSEVHNYYK